MKQSVLVIGLGRFGTAAAFELMRLGHDVLAVDADEQVVNDVAPDVTHAIQADATDVDALKAIGAGDFEHAIVAISSKAEPSIFATMALKQLGVRNVVAKAGTTLHGAILERVGADRVVYPEREMGARVAHEFNIRTSSITSMSLRGSGSSALRPPESWVGKTLREINLAERLGLTPIALRRGDHVTVNPNRDERLSASDELVLIGRDDKLAELGE